MQFGLENAQSLVGVAAVLLICWGVSENRRRFPWKLAIGAIAVQAILVLALFGLPALQAGLQNVSVVVDGLASATQAGVAFVFGFLAGTPDQPYQLASPGMMPFVFAFRVLPVILVVCALAALLWHWKILVWITRAFGVLFERTMGLRGPPALATAATVFMGQVEGPIFIRSYLPNLSRSELFMLIAVGMACVSGSTMVAYATILHDVLPNAAAHVLTASIVSAPAGVLLARIIVPRDAAIESAATYDPAASKRYDSSIDALIKGTTDGLQIVLNVGATLIVFVALVAMLNSILGMLGDVNGAPVSVERGLGIVFSPLAWAIGVPWKGRADRRLAAGREAGADRVHRLHPNGRDPTRGHGPALACADDLAPMRLRQRRLGGHQPGGLFGAGARAAQRDRRHGLEGNAGGLPGHLPDRLHRGPAAGQTVRLGLPQHRQRLAEVALRRDDVVARAMSSTTRPRPSVQIAIASRSMKTSIGRRSPARAARTPSRKIFRKCQGSRNSRNENTILPPGLSTRRASSRYQ
jgi:CNT family concentrative nucleoside transporter